MKIMIADDNVDIRETIKCVLMSIGATFYQYSNGREVVDEYSKVCPDWVLMDIQMPEMDGLRATEVIKIIDPEAKVIIVTNHDDPEFRAEAERLGTRGYVLKEHLTDIRKMLT